LTKLRTQFTLMRRNIIWISMARIMRNDRFAITVRNIDITIAINLAGQFVNRYI